MYYIKFVKPHVLEISRFRDLENINVRYPIRLKTLATINAFLNLLNINDELHHLISGYTLQVYIPYEILPVGDQKKFRDKIRQHRYKCHLKNICCSIISKSISIYYFKDNIEPVIFPHSPLVVVNYYWDDSTGLTEAYNNVNNYLGANNYTKEFDIEKLPQGGISVLYCFNKHYDNPEKDNKLLNLLGLLKIECQASGWKFAVEYANFKNYIVLQIFRGNTDLYTQYSGSRRLGLTIDCRKKSGIQC